MGSSGRVETKQKTVKPLTHQPRLPLPALEALRRTRVEASPLANRGAL